MAVDDLLDLAGEKFVVLTTFRRSGVGVPTTVWVAAESGALVVTTPAGSGKVKRLRRDDRVTLQPSSRSGRVAADAPVVSARAVIEQNELRRSRAASALVAKYGLSHRFVTWLERRLGDGRNRVILRLTDDPSSRPDDASEQ